MSLALNSFATMAAVYASGTIAVVAIIAIDELKVAHRRGYFATTSWDLRRLLAWPVRVGVALVRSQDERSRSIRGTELTLDVDRLADAENGRIDPRRPYFGV